MIYRTTRASSLHSITKWGWYSPLALLNTSSFSPICTRSVACLSSVDGDGKPNTSYNKKDEVDFSIGHIINLR